SCGAAATRRPKSKTRSAMPAGKMRRDADRLDDPDASPLSTKWCRSRNFFENVKTIANLRFDNINFKFVIRRSSTTLRPPTIILPFKFLFPPIRDLLRRDGQKKAPVFDAFDADERVGEREHSPGWLH